MDSTLRPVLRGSSMAVLVATSLLGACGPNPVPTNQSTAGITLTDKDNGTTVFVQVGQEVTLVLGSTYWTIAGSSDSTVLRLDGAPEIAPDPSCVAGQGCGTVTTHFIAVGG